MTSFALPRGAGRIASAFFPPAAAAFVGLVLPVPHDFIDRPLLFAGWTLLTVASLALYLVLTRKAHPLREALPTAVVFLALTSLVDTFVHYVLTSPALRGALTLRILGIDFTNGTLLPNDLFAPFLEQAANLLLVAILITILHIPGFYATYPKKLHGVLLATFLGYVAILLMPILLYTQLLMHITPARTFTSAELFLLLVPILLGLFYFFNSTAALRRLEEQRRALAEKDADLAAQRFYNQQVEPLVDTLRRQRHGHENNLAALAGLVHARDLEGLDRWLAESAADHGRTAPIDEAAFHRIRSAALLGLLSAKATLAQEIDVAFEIDARTAVADLPIPVFTLCEILGILLDNALEAAAPSFSRRARFEVHAVDRALSFRVSNTYAEPPDLDRLGEKGYTTKPGGRGHGLHFVRTHLRHLHGVQLNTTIEAPWFHQELLVPDAAPISSQVRNIIENTIYTNL